MVVEEKYESRQISTLEVLGEIIKIYEEDIQRKKEQAGKGFDGLTFFIYRMLMESNIKNTESVSKQIKEEFLNHPNWKTGDKKLRELRKRVYFALLSEEDDIDKAANLIDDLFNHLFMAYGI